MAEEKDLIKVAKIIDEYTVVINRGRHQGIKEGQRFLIYSIGEEIIDPDTKQSLGQLEIVKGTGKVAHLQDSMSQVSSDMKAPPLRSIKRVKSHESRYDAFAFKDFFQPSEIEEQLPAEKIAFDKVKIGDLARPI